MDIKLRERFHKEMNYFYLRRFIRYIPSAQSHFGKPFERMGRKASGLPALLN